MHANRYPGIPCAWPARGVARAVFSDREGRGAQSPRTQGRAQHPATYTRAEPARSWPTSGALAWRGRVRAKRGARDRQARRRIRTNARSIAGKYARGHSSGGLKATANANVITKRGRSAAIVAETGEAAGTSAIRRRWSRRLGGRNRFGRCWPRRRRWALFRPPQLLPATPWRSREPGRMLPVPCPWAAQT